MMSLLAQTQPADFGPWLANAAYLMVLVTSAVVLYQRMRARPQPTEISGQPLTVQGATRYTPIEQHAKLEDRVDGLDAELKEIDRRRSQSVAGIYDEMRKVSAQSQKAAEKTDLTHAQLQGVDGKVDRLIDAVGELRGRVAK